jgi:hypothetical protein
MLYVSGIGIKQIIVCLIINKLVYRVTCATISVRCHCRKHKNTTLKLSKRLHTIVVWFRYNKDYSLNVSGWFQYLHCLKKDEEVLKVSIVIQRRNRGLQHVTTRSLVLRKYCDGIIHSDVKVILGIILGGC